VKTSRFWIMLICAMPCAADETPAAPPAASAVPVQAMPAAVTRTLAARPRQVPLGAPANATGADDSSTKAATNPSAATVKFVSEAKWLTAGYNNDEIVYTVIVTNQDSHVLHCTAQVSGYYFDQGKKLSISDRQVATVFPNQPAQIGMWMDFDRSSGASYSVTCRPI
jgi:hypothetical protein